MKRYEAPVLLLLALTLYLVKDSLSSRQNGLLNYLVLESARRKRPGGIWVKHFSHGDRSGAILLTVMTAHAYAYAIGAKFNGLCHNNQNRVNEVLRCLEGAGLKNFLNISCPPGYNESMGFKHRNIIGQMRSDYLTPEWLSFVKNLSEPILRNSTSFTVAVHVRRGDVSPCSKRYLGRYLPNSYYLDLIQRHVPKNVTSEVTIFSESKTVESFDDFTDLGYKLALDTDLTDVWKNFVTSDAFIVSSSTFSTVAGIFNEGKVILAPNEAEPWQRRLPHIAPPRLERIGFASTREAQGRAERLLVQRVSLS